MPSVAAPSKPESVAAIPVGAYRIAAIFQNSAIRVLMAWSVACGLILAAFMTGGALGEAPATIGEAQPAIVISLASGLISLAAIVPGLVIGRSQVADSAGQASVALIGCVAAMAIRSLSTVALFVVCRYYFGDESKSVVFLVIGWYVYLTSFEVFTLARGIASLDQKKLRTFDVE